MDVGPSSSTDDHPATTTNQAKMVETDSQQLPGGGPVPTVVPESDEATTTNPSMNGLEAHFTNGGVGDTNPLLAQPSTSSSFNSPSTSASANVTTSVAAAQEQSANTTHSRAATSMEAAAAPKLTTKISLDSDQDHLLSVEATAVPEKRVGCAHYKRRAKFVTPCCNKLYMCRYCHDEHETHYFNRKTVTQLICTECDTRQRVQAECEKCGVRFGKYTCLVCNLFDDEDKDQYHCDGCGICRIGGKDRFFHCEVCNMCLPMQLKIDGHRCVENVSRSNCPVCLEDIHTSRIPCHIPDCGHLLHRTCFEDLLSSGHYACPTCQTSMIDMKKLWDYLDAELENTPMPTEYASYFVNILCKDCHKESKITYHVVGLKCGHCGAYNTCQTGQKEAMGGGGTPVDGSGEEAAAGNGGNGGSSSGGGDDDQEQQPPPSSSSSSSTME